MLRRESATGIDGRSDPGRSLTPADRLIRLRGQISLLPGLMLAMVVVVDKVISRIDPSVPALAMLDWCGHLLTAGLILSVFPRSAVSRLVPWALLGSVAIDADHIPLYTFAPGFDVGGRPPTHSLATVATLGVFALFVPRARVPLLGLASGVCLHFVRDAATGPGVPLLWPLAERTVLVPHAAYLGLLGAVAIVSTWTLRSGRGWKPISTLPASR